MTAFTTLLQQGNAWLFVPSAILLGALHGLEPGHSKTLMAAFIVAVRGTMTQAVLLGLSATVSHTAVVWAVAMAGLYFGRNWSADAAEPYFQVASAVIMIGVAAWMVWRLRQGHDHGHDHDHDHGHSHGADAEKRIETGCGTLRLEVFEEGVPPRFRLWPDPSRAQALQADAVSLETEWTDGSRQSFRFAQRNGYLESTAEIPEPHEFVARLCLGPSDSGLLHSLEFVEHAHEHDGADDAALELATGGYQDAHEREHAHEIQRRFANRHVTTGQIIVFGLTGGLIPCPASITILLLCLQIKKIALGATLVLCFSIGLALTMVASGALAALSVKHVSRRWGGFGDFARRAPYLSCGLIVIVALYVGYQGLHALA